MPKRVKNLTAVEVSRITKPGRHAVGTMPGLLLVVKPTGAKSWILRTMVGIKRRSIGLGGYPDITLAMAWEKSRKIKAMIEKGFDPVEEKRKIKEALKKEQMQYMSFAEAVIKTHKKKSQEFKNEKHAKDWISSVNRYAIPLIGDMPVSEIDLPQIRSVLDPIWAEKTETATRLRQRLEQILNWAAAAGYRIGENPARWKGHLSEILADPTKIKKQTHFKALPWQEIGAFMVELRKRPAMAARALEWIILTACRPGEARLATWEEIDLENRIWIVPAERMKTSKEHRVPLCADAIKLLKNLPHFKGSKYLFTAPRGGPLSDMAISMLCRRMKVEAVPHGFRSTFKDWCSETTSFPNIVSEMALGHAIDSKVEAAYRKGDLLDKRRRLMDAWAEYCNIVQSESTGNNVTPVKQKMA